MKNFYYYNPTRIHFGKGAVSFLPEELSRLGAKKVLLHFGGGSVFKNGSYSATKDALEKSGVTVLELGGVQPNPRLSLVREGVALCKREGVDTVLALGGGSVVDSAKAIAMGACYEGDVWDLYSTVKPTVALPVGVILTNAAAGSENSENSVISNEEAGIKKGSKNECIRPTFSLLDPEYTHTVPLRTTMAGVTDIFAHMFERYFTPEKNILVTDRLIEGACSALIQKAYRLKEEPTDPDARAEVMWCSTVAHNDYLSVGRTGDWACHKIEHELSARYDIPHGEGLAIVIPAWMKYTYKTDPDKFIQFFEGVFGLRADKDNKEASVLAGISYLEGFLSAMGMPLRLSDVGIDEKDFEYMASHAIEVAGTDRIGVFKPLDAKDVLEILTLAK